MGVKTPLLANIALHGLEQAAAAAYRSKDGSPFLVRYADDFVVLHPQLEGIEASRTAIEHWLDGMGLHLSLTKTRVSHTLHTHEGNVGFDFLGFTVRQYTRGRCHTAKNTKGQPLGFKTFITPSKSAVKRHLHDLGTRIRQHRTISQQELIGLLNPAIKGWATYYRSVVATETFQACDHAVVQMLLWWGRRRHRNKSVDWTVQRYWHHQGTRRWVFASADGVTLRCHSDTAIKRPVKVQGTASPFDGHLVYWAQRLRHHPLTSSTLAYLLRRQGGACAWCGLVFRNDDCIEIDHVTPTAGGGRTGSRTCRPCTAIATAPKQHAMQPSVRA